MLHSITPPNTSRASTFTWVKGLLAREGRDVISSDEPTGFIETQHAVFHVIEKDAGVDYPNLGAAFVAAARKNANFAILAPHLSIAAVRDIDGFDYPGIAALRDRNEVVATKVVIATTDATIEQAVIELTQVNTALRALGTMYALQEKYWLLPIVGVAAIIEDIVHAPDIVQNPTFSVLYAVLACKLIVWIGGRQRVSAARRQFERSRA